MNQTSSVNERTFLRRENEKMVVEKESRAVSTFDDQILLFKIFGVGTSAFFVCQFNENIFMHSRLVNPNSFLLMLHKNLIGCLNLFKCSFHFDFID